MALVMISLHCRQVVKKGSKLNSNSQPLYARVRQLMVFIVHLHSYALSHIIAFNKPCPELTKRKTF